MKTSSKPHWQDRPRHISNGRMAWYGEPGDEHYWYEYWKARLTSDYYTSAEANALSSDELGKVLLQVMSPQGLHLEAGCGAGYWVASLRHYGLMIEGIEYSPKLVDLVHSVNPRPRTFSLRSLPRAQTKGKDTHFSSLFWANTQVQKSLVPV